jgi:predicted GNAT family acetyltransferase
MFQPRPNSVTRNEALSRFELVEDGQTAFADYRLHGEAVVIPHVESPIALRGKGTAGRLMEGVAELARDGSFKVVPVCSYAVHWFRRHPQWRDVLA